MRKLLPSTLILIGLLSGCATARHATVQAICPAIPPLEQPSALLEPTYSDRMASFLAGKVPEQTPYDYSLSAAKPPMKQPGTR